MSLSDSVRLRPFAAAFGQANAQTVAGQLDDWIWLASKNQLYRFDGVTAELAACRLPT
jgi:hypothetical protein